MESYNGSTELKAQHVALAEHHLAADMLIAGTYGEGTGKRFKACSVGCFAHDYKLKGELHELLAEKIGWPEWLVRLEDSMFEGLPADERGTFHVELAKRVPVGVDLAPVQHWIAVARIDRNMDTLRPMLEAKHGNGVHEAIEGVIAALDVGRRAHEAAAGGNVCELPAARSAAWAARSAAESAESAAWSAWSAAESAARSAARSAAESAWAARSAAESAESAAWSARSARSAAESAWSAAESAWAARSAAWKQERDALFAALARLESKQ